MRTSDGVEIVHELRIWATTPTEPTHPEPGTVDLKTGSVVLHTDSGKTMTIDPRGALATHPQTRTSPPRLGVCQWTLACNNLAIRMQPHRLMSPVPVCTTCIKTYNL